MQVKTVFLTGISGFLGAHIAQQLLQEGHLVKGLVRHKAGYTGVLHPNLTLIEGHLFSDLIQVMQGVDVVIHAAAETRQHLLHYNDYLRVNVDATVLLFQTAVHCRVKQFIFISTANTIGYGSEHKPGEEILPMKTPFHRSYYATSKLEAEHFLLHSNHDLQVAILNPTFMIGAFGNTPSSCRIILMGWKKKIIFYPPGGKNFVHVKDVAQAVLKLMQTGINKQQLLIAGQNLSYREFFERFIRLANQQTRLVKVPALVLYLMGYIGDGLRCLGIATSIYSTTMKVLTIRSFYTNKKSKQALGLSYRSIDAAIEETIDHLNQKNS